MRTKISTHDSEGRKRWLNAVGWRGMTKRIRETGRWRWVGRQVGAAVEVETKEGSK